MSDDPNKLPPDVPGLPTMDTTAAEQTVGGVIFDLFKRHTVKFIIGNLLFWGTNFGAIRDAFANITRAEWVDMGWWQVAGLLAGCLYAGCFAVIGYLMPSPLAAKPDSK